MGRIARAKKRDAKREGDVLRQNTQQSSRRSNLLSKLGAEAEDMMTYAEERRRRTVPSSVGFVRPRGQYGRVPSPPQSLARFSVVGRVGGEVFPARTGQY